MGAASGYVISCPATASQISSLQRRTPFFADARICRWNASSSRIRTSRSHQVVDSVIPCSHPASIQRASLKEQISRRCYKCCAVIVRRAGLPCMRTTLTPSVSLSKQLSTSTIKVWNRSNAPIAGRSVGRDSAVIKFLRGAYSIFNPPRPRTVPPWDLPTVLKALKGPPFEPLQSSSLRVLLLKTTLLLALASVKRVGDLQALSANPACLEFGPETKA